MCDEVDEYAEVWNQRVRKARREHQCCACGEIIRKGDHYHYTSGIFGARAFDYKHCVRCMLTINRLEIVTGRSVDIHLNCGTVYGGLDSEMLSFAFMTPDENLETKSFWIEYRDHRGECIRQLITPVALAHRKQAEAT